LKKINRVPFLKMKPKWLKNIYSVRKTEVRKTGSNTLHLPDLPTF
jgi:hypothetical protein